MIRTQQSGFTLVELLVVSLITAITLAGVYRTLMTQEKTYEAAGVRIQEQESLRTGMAILESELREIGSIGGSAIGGSDIDIATADSIRFRAQRKMGFICKLDKGSHTLTVWTMGDDFERQDQLLYFIDNDTLRWNDDAWDTTFVTGVATASDSDCTNAWPGMDQQQLTIDTNVDLTGVWGGAVIRSYDWVTYGIYSFGHLGWGLGRNEGSGPQYLVGGLAQQGTGLQFEYFDATGSATTSVDQVARIRITMETDPRTDSSVEPGTMSTNLFLRNN